MDVCLLWVLSGWGLCDWMITRPGESYRMWRVVLCDQENSKTRRLKPATGLWKYNHSGLQRQEIKQTVAWEKVAVSRQPTDVFPIIITQYWLLPKHPSPTGVCCGKSVGFMCRSNCIAYINFRLQMVTANCFNTIDISADIAPTKLKIPPLTVRKIELYVNRILQTAAIQEYHEITS